MFSNIECVAGVILGYVVYIVLAFFSGDLRENSIDLAIHYFPDKQTWLDSLRDPTLEEEPAEEGQHKEEEGGQRETVTSTDGTARTDSKVTTDSNERKSEVSRLHLSMSLDADSLKQAGEDTKGKTLPHPPRRVSAINFSGVFESHKAHRTPKNATSQANRPLPSLKEHGRESSVVERPSQMDVENALHACSRENMMTNQVQNGV